tara:strand:+ start:126 stop:296 length:171 start_codon:yes stop_codon:yes gene_type:complete
MDKDIESVINALLAEPILTLEDRVLGVDIIPKEAHKYYNPKTGRCYTTGIPYSSPP